MRTRRLREAAYPLVFCPVVVAMCLVVSGHERGPEAKASGQRESRTGNAPGASHWRQPLYRPWSPERLFDDPQVIRLCNAIADRDYEQIDRLVKIEGVNVNSKGFQDMTPLLWAFPLCYLEIVQNVPEEGDETTDEFNRAMAAHQTKVFEKHSRLFEHLMKLGADPNAKLSKRPSRVSPAKWVNSPFAFDMREGLAFVHVCTHHYLSARYNFFRMVMANGGDPSLIYDYRGVTPIFLICNNAKYLPNGACPFPRSEPKSLALLIDAGVDLEFRDPQENFGRPKGNTPILAAAEAGHFDLVYMLIHAGADYRVSNVSGWRLARYVDEYLRTIQKLPEKKTGPKRPHEIDAYFLDVIDFLEKEGMMSQGTYAGFKAQVDHAVKESDKVVYAERDPFVEEWVAKRKEQRRETAKAATATKATE